jgi:RNA polymerase sigma factor (TIGR02999 family)
MPDPAQTASRGRITDALHAARCRQAGATEQLFRLIEPELRSRAARLRGRLPSDPGSQTTTLVHDTFLGLGAERTVWQNRDHYLAAATRTMKRLILDLVRSRRRLKRGGSRPIAELSDQFAARSRDLDLLLDLDAALERLGRLRPRWKQLAELRVFGGLSNPAIASVLGVSSSTVEHDWAFVRAWLHRDLARG